MTINEYQKLAMRTAPKRFESREEMLLNGVNGALRRGWRGP